MCLKTIIKLEKGLVVTFLAMLILLVFFSAVFRWFGVSVAWSTDVAQMLFAWLSFIGADLALRQNKHVGIDMLTRHFSPSAQNSLALAINVLILAFCLLNVIFGTNLVIVNYRRMFNTLPISYSFVTAACPVGCALMSWTTVQRILFNIRNIRKKDYSQINYAQLDEEAVVEVEGGQVA